MASKLVALWTVLALGAAMACQPSYTACQPNSATGSTLPPVGTKLATLFTDLLSSIEHVPPPAAEAKGLLTARDATEICCADGTACLNLVDFNIPFCYDRFTTNFFLADGSTGTLDNGTLNFVGGPHVNMIQGNYTSEGTSANIYGTATPPERSTLAVPTPYTSAGVGGAIPLTDLAGIVTVTTTIPGTTLAASTLPATTEAVTVFGGVTMMAVETSTALDGSIMLPTEVTVSGGSTETQDVTKGTLVIPATTIFPSTMTFTTAVPSASSTSTSEGHRSMQKTGVGFLWGWSAMLLLYELAK